MHFICPGPRAWHLLYLRFRMPLPFRCCASCWMRVVFKQQQHVLAVLRQPTALYTRMVKHGPTIPCGTSGTTMEWLLPLRVSDVIAATIRLLHLSVLLRTDSRRFRTLA